MTGKGQSFFVGGAGGGGFLVVCLFFPYGM